MLFFIIGFSIMVLIAPIGEAISEAKKSQPGMKFKNAFEGAATVLIAEAFIIGVAVAGEVFQNPKCNVNTT